VEDKFLQFEKNEDGKNELYIYGEIRKANLLEKIWEFEADDGRVDALTFAEALELIDGDNLTVHINSYGGSVSEGLAIYNALKSCGKTITTTCDGFACSAASVIYCAGDVRIQPKTALLMIHNAWTQGGEGNAQYFRKLAEDLDKITQPSVEAYKAVSNLSEEEIKNLMDEETWITAEEAKEWGFTTEIPSEKIKQEVQQEYMHTLVANNHKLKEKVKELEELQKKTGNNLANGWDKFF
jgi:ATP-dependent Clp protease protease subunit